jgi:hypothetical protein
MENNAAQALEPKLPLTRDEVYITCCTMQRFGGSFLHALVEAFYKADTLNALRIMSTWSQEFRQYGPRSAFYERYLRENPNALEEGDE